MTENPPATSVCLLRCEGCGHATVRALTPPRQLTTRNGAVVGCLKCGRRWQLRLRQGLASLQLEWLPMARVDLTPAPKVPEPPKPAVPGWQEIYQAGGGPDGVSWVM